MVKAMDCGVVVSEFERQLRYYVHFRTNLNRPSPPAINELRLGFFFFIVLNFALLNGRHRIDGRTIIISAKLK